MNKRISKPFLTYTSQLYNLIYNKKLSIRDTEYAKSKLQDICYYSSTPTKVNKTVFILFIIIHTYLLNVFYQTFSFNSF